jgi:tetratricopeptide (TPR) repeat protein
MRPPSGPAARRTHRPLRSRSRPPGQLLLAWLVIPLLSLLLLGLPAAALAAGASPAQRAGLVVRAFPPNPSRDAVSAPGAALTAAGAGVGAASPAPAPQPAPGGDAALFERALAASRAGSFAVALPLWDQVLELRPQDAAAWSNRGNVRLALGDAEGAIDDQGRAMSLDPDQPDPHLNRGTAEEALGRWQAAAADYQWILERDPRDASALYNLGNVNGTLGDWQAARDCFMAAADARPGFAMARSSAALAVFQLGDLGAAEQQLRSLIRRYPLFADARAGLTALLWRRGAQGEAESHWAAASGLDPRYRQADWLLEIRRWPPEPARALQQFLALSPQAPVSPVSSPG